MSATLDKLNLLGSTVISSQKIPQRGGIFLKPWTSNSLARPRHNFFGKLGFEGLLIDRMESNEEIFGKLMSDKDFRDMTVEHLLGRVYKKLKRDVDKVTV